MAAFAHARLLLANVEIAKAKVMSSCDMPCDLVSESGFAAHADFHADTLDLHLQLTRAQINVLCAVTSTHHDVPEQRLTQVCGRLTCQAAHADMRLRQPAPCCKASAPC